MGEIAARATRAQAATVEVDGVLVGSANKSSVNAIGEVVLLKPCEQRPRPCAHVDRDGNGRLTVEDIAVENESDGLTCPLNHVSS